MTEQWSASHSRSGGEASVLREMPDYSLRSLAAVVGELPSGDVPKAWWSSLHPEVIEGWENYKLAQGDWNDHYAELLAEVGVAPDTKFMTAAKAHLIGLVPPKGAGITSASAPRWMRRTREGVWVPRKRTIAERKSKVAALFARVEHVPQPVEFVPGMPDTLWTHAMAYPVHMRRSTQRLNPSGSAVLAFVAINPDDADPVFEVSAHWTRMKLSTFHMLRERQEAAKQ